MQEAFCKRRKCLFIAGRSFLNTGSTFLNTGITFLNAGKILIAGKIFFKCRKNIFFKSSKADRLQETRNYPLKNTPNFNFLNLNRTFSNNVNNLYVGGGIAIGIFKDLSFRDVSSTIPTAVSENIEILAI